MRHSTPQARFACNKQGTVPIAEQNHSLLRVHAACCAKRDRENVKACPLHQGPTSHHAPALSKNCSVRYQ